MKESILGRSRLVMLRLVALAGFLFFVGIGTTYSQIPVTSDVAAGLLRAEITQFKSQASSSPLAYNGPEAILSVSPQLYANYFMADAVAELVYVQGNQVDLIAAIAGAKQKGLQLAKVDQIYFQSAEVYLMNLLTN